MKLPQDCGAPAGGYGNQDHGQAPRTPRRPPPAAADPEALHPALQRVLKKMVHMSQTLGEIDRWLDTVDPSRAQWVAGVEPPPSGVGRMGPVTIDNLDGHIQRESGEARERPGLP